MSRLLIVTRPALAAGFQLAGVDAYGVEDAESAQELIGGWLDAGEAGLLALDDGYLSRLDTAFIERLNSSNLAYLAIPGGETLGSAASRQHRIAEMIRYAIGFRITFKGTDTEAAS